RCGCQRSPPRRRQGAGAGATSPIGRAPPAPPPARFALAGPRGPLLTEPLPAGGPGLLLLLLLLFLLVGGLGWGRRRRRAYLPCSGRLLHGVFAGAWFDGVRGARRGPSRKASMARRRARAPAEVLAGRIAHASLLSTGGPSARGHPSRAAGTRSRRSRCL
ncbi:unnamed protein product, partial [Prorocentrum cordatum]